MPATVRPLCRPPHRLFASLAAGLAALLLLTACPSTSQGPADGEAAHGEEEGQGQEEVELAVLMGQLQHHSSKLGYAIQGRHAELADFYLHETEDSLEAIRDVETYEGMPIAHPVGVIMDPLLPPLEKAVDSADWGAARESYEALVAGCNRCHTATEHGFLVILPAEGEPPFDQLFTPRQSDEPAG